MFILVLKILIVSVFRPLSMLVSFSFCELEYYANCRKTKINENKQTNRRWNDKKNNWIWCLVKKINLTIVLNLYEMVSNHWLPIACRSYNNNNNNNNFLFCFSSSHLNFCIKSSETMSIVAIPLGFEIVSLLKFITGVCNPNEFFFLLNLLIRMVYNLHGLYNSLG